MDRDHYPTANAASGLMQGAAVGSLNKAARPPESRATVIANRLNILNGVLCEVRGMTFAATERIVGNEPSPVNDPRVTGLGQGTEAAMPCFMAQAENAIGELERLANEIRDELGRINRAF